MASIRMDLQVTESGGTPVAVTAGAADFIALERKYGIGPKDLGDNPRLEYLAFLAWSAMRRTGPGVPDFDTFVGTLDDIEGESGKGQDPPTAPSP